MMIKTKFDGIIADDTLHDKFALNKKGELGRFQLWAWNNCYRFLNFDTGKTSTISLSKLSNGNLNNYTILTSEEFDKSYKEKNRPANLFNENRLFIGDRTKYTERQVSYGLIHDNLLHLSEKETNKLWSVEFCEAIAFIISQYNFYCEVMKTYGTLDNLKKFPEASKKLIEKYMISYDCSDMYAVKLTLGMGRENDTPTISESDIHKSIKKIYNLPDEYRKKIMTSIIVKAAKKEVSYYENFK
jgi:hypothetical protein